MRGKIEFTARDREGEAILDKMERRAGVGGVHTGVGSRYYTVDATEVGGFTGILSRIDPAWREHISDR